MGAIVVGHWEQGWDVPGTEFNWWHFPLRDLGVEAHYMIPVTGIHTGTPPKVLEAATLQEVIDANPGYTKVFVDEGADVWLDGFTHPTNAIYILGRSSYSPFLVEKQEGDLSVKIKTVENLGLLWAHQAASIVLYDRLMKV